MKNKNIWIILVIIVIIMMMNQPRHKQAISAPTLPVVDYANTITWTYTDESTGPDNGVIAAYEPYEIYNSWTIHSHSGQQTCDMPVSQISTTYTDFLNPDSDGDLRNVNSIETSFHYWLHTLKPGGTPTQGLARAEVFVTDSTNSISIWDYQISGGSETQEGDIRIRLDLISGNNWEVFVNGVSNGIQDLGSLNFGEQIKLKYTATGWVTDASCSGFPAEGQSKLYIAYISSDPVTTSEDRTASGNVVTYHNQDNGVYDRAYWAVRDVASSCSINSVSCSTPNSDCNYVGGEIRVVSYTEGGQMAPSVSVTVDGTGSCVLDNGQWVLSKTGTLMTAPDGLDGSAVLTLDIIDCSTLKTDALNAITAWAISPTAGNKQAALDAIIAWVSNC